MISQSLETTSYRRSTVVNDHHSKLNATAVKGVVRPVSLIQLSEMVKVAAAQGAQVSISGGRHAMGGQQFLQNRWLIDMTGLDRVLEFDAQGGTIRCEAGATWPGLLEQLGRLQLGQPKIWTFAQKQTGADYLTLGGAVAANIHGRGLKFGPFIQDVLAVEIVTSEGKLMRCSRTENPELFRLVAGGYGLFGAIYALTLKLVERQAMRRVVEITVVDNLIEQFDAAIGRGAIYGDFQYAIDPETDDFLRRGVFSVYERAPDEAPGSDQKTLRPEDWERLLRLAHTEKSEAFREYSDYYKSTNGQVYWSDTLQLSHYPEGYHERIDQCLGTTCTQTEMISELFVPRRALGAFLQSVRSCERKYGWNLIYGTIRLIEPDNETFLAWARERWACVIFNICVEHSPMGIEKAKKAFRHLIQLAMDNGGSYYLTYHRWATREQLLACYPQFPTFLALKQQFDPGELFASDWYFAMKRLVE